MDLLNSTQQPPFSTPSPMAPTDHSLDEVDESPEPTPRSAWQSRLQSAFGKADPQIIHRRESLLTRQLHSETEHTDDDDHPRAPPRALSTQSVWSNPSVASTAELTSDDGHSLASPAVSPPLLPTAIRTMIPLTEKSLSREPQIMSQEDKVTGPGSEKSVEAGLGRKRCISFACGNKEKKPPTAQPAKASEPQSSTSPPKRKCMLKFVCPTRTGSESKPSEQRRTGAERPATPPPPARSLSPKLDVARVHRGSDSTVTHVSPKSVRKSPAITTAAPTPTTRNTGLLSSHRMSQDSDDSTEATRFHEFASSDGEPEEWVQESTCHRSRLTVTDTLHKENVLRAAYEEVEAEAVQEEEDEDDDEDGDDGDDNDGEGEDEDDDIEGEEESDEGFHTDDEDGFAESDSEGEGSDEEWWRPGGPSTAATSVDHLERLALTKRTETTLLSSSVGSASSAQASPRRSVPPKSRRKRRSDALTIEGQHDNNELPDSTDFVCGTLDEDRPREQAFLNNLKQKEAAKHKARPQDIDPTFPTSDPDMDEEDDEDLERPVESEHDSLMHGDLDELNGDYTARQRPLLRTRPTSNHVSPAPRHRSPAPTVIKRTNTGTARSPPPPVRRSTARSPPPRKLFGPSPRTSRSPAPKKRMPSPPNVRHASPMMASGVETNVLARRPQPSHTASLPRDGFMFGKLNSLHVRDGEGHDPISTKGTGGGPKRGAIDIFKGLEKKRQRRKEKLYQKACAKAAAKGEKTYKVKPGKGAERMREVGLELQRYKGGHILSM